MNQAFKRARELFLERSTPPLARTYGWTLYHTMLECGNKREDALEERIKNKEAAFMDRPFVMNLI